MDPLNRADAIIDFCLSPLALDPNAQTTLEVRRRLEHVIKTYQTKITQPVAVDFSKMPSLVINEAAHGYE
ncbi:MULTISPECIES: hypothetical protein [unclassified Asticcacaulis]|uniref:hypothetical protein n=1 Tax=unclassified Asticcacaulis TaxID=2628350 RepID=UPI0003C3EFC3|nr:MULTISPECIES: hypothetical protein [unclassified Asticcacaulis]ESQ84755.1 hypothetical protein AEAC466_06780 [Asticcacaulis sp. AC466]MDV6332163.1 hypothetical protein [Asticcacaulis sp. 201]